VRQKIKTFHPSDRHLLTAIIKCSDPLQGNNGFAKYHNIKDTPTKLAEFIAMAKEKFSTAQYVNFYRKMDKSFKERIYIE